jgi:hypothetical protein
MLKPCYGFVLASMTGRKVIDKVIVTPTRFSVEASRGIDLFDDRWLVIEELPFG